MPNEVVTEKVRRAEELRLNAFNAHQSAIWLKKEAEADLKKARAKAANWSGFKVEDLVGEFQCRALISINKAKLAEIELGRAKRHWRDTQAVYKEAVKLRDEAREEARSSS